MATTVVAAISGYGQAYNLGARPFDLGRVEAFYSKRTLTIGIPGSPDRMFRGWEEYSSAWERMVENFSEFYFTPNGDLELNRIGKVAWASQTGQSHGIRVDGKSFRRDVRQTLVLADEGDAWRIVQEHVSLTPA